MKKNRSSLASKIIAAGALALVASLIVLLPRDQERPQKTANKQAAEPAQPKQVTAPMSGANATQLPRANSVAPQRASLRPVTMPFTEEDFSEMLRP